MRNRRNFASRRIDMLVKPIIHGVRTLAQTRVFRVEAVDLEFSNGQRREFERINNGNAGAVMVMPLTADSLIMVREYAVGSEHYELGFVKGLIDPGETPVEAANRELKEEIGFGARDINLIRNVRLTPHYNTAVGYMLLAEDLYEESGEGDEPEPLEQLHWPLTDIDSLLDHPDINDVRTLYALYWVRDHLQSRHAPDALP
jgi:ADP-ribose diphosphatase